MTITTIRDSQGRESQAPENQINKLLHDNKLLSRMIYIPINNLYIFSLTRADESSRPLVSSQFLRGYK
jgi:hypothetical protein